jgi:hypothetical protein
MNEEEGIEKIKIRVGWEKNGEFYNGEYSIMIFTFNYG